MDEPAVPLKVQHAAIQHSIDQTKANFEKNKELSNLLEGIREKRTKEVNEFLGSKAKEYREFLEKGREIARTMRPLYTATPEGRRIKSQFQKTRLDESNKFIKSLGINVNDFKSIISKYQEESKSIIEKTRAIEGSLELDVSPMPPEIIHPEPDSPWLSFHPPYLNGLGFGDAYHVESGDAAFGPYMKHYESFLTGEISRLTQNVIYDAGDYAHQMTVGSSNMFLLFQMPASGRLNVWSQLQCVESSYWGSLRDFAGISDATTMQSSKYYIAIGDPPGEEAAYFRLLDDFGHPIAEHVGWADNMAMPGEYKTFNLVTNNPYSAGQWIRMRTGILDVQDGVCDDMSFLGEIKNSWILQGVFVSAFNP